MKNNKFNFREYLRRNIIDNHSWSGEGADSKMDRWWGAIILIIVVLLFIFHILGVNPNYTEVRIIGTNDHYISATDI